jgi:hypothetical protein
VEEVGLTGVTPTPIFNGGNVEINNCTLGGGLGSSPGGFPSFTVRCNLSCENNGNACVLDGAEIGGNARFINNQAVNVFNATIGGNLSVSDNKSANATDEVAAVAGDNVGGNVAINNNATGIVIVGGNVIGGNLRCVGNSQQPNDDNNGPNTVNGHKLGQCSSL